MNTIIRKTVNKYDIKDVRQKLKMTQKTFAELIGVSKPTVERWESSDKEVGGMTPLLVEILQRHPEIVEELSIPQKTYPVRMFYMFKNMVCTLIDVDELNQEVRIKNYHRNIMFRAFGANEHPSYEDYKEFLESRCFPRERDNMKLMLRELDIPFYDPFLIVEKTQGRMYEDDFWIRIEN